MPFRMSARTIVFTITNVRIPWMNLARNGQLEISTSRGTYVVTPMSPTMACQYCCGAESLWEPGRDPDRRGKLDEPATVFWLRIHSVTDEALWYMA